MKKSIAKIAAVTLAALALAGPGTATASSADAATATAPCGLVTVSVHDNASGADGSRDFTAVELSGHTIDVDEEDSRMMVFIDPNNSVENLSFGFHATNEDADTATFHVSITCETGQTLADQDVNVPDSETFALPVG